MSILAGLSTGCAATNGVGKGGQVDESLTETLARDRITTYLRETLQALPPGVGLSITPDNPSLGTLGPDNALAVPCDDDNAHPDGPVQEQIRYWVTGVPLGQTTKYFGMIRSIWTGRGFRLNPDSDSRWAATMSPDGYGLVVQDAGKGDGSLSITAGSPCYPKTGKGGAPPQPTEIKRPS